MTKTIGVLIVILLIVLIAVQLFTWIFPPLLSAECRQAMRTAASMDPERVYSDYRRAAYEQADNIYQQQFVATEYTFLTLQAIAAQNVVMIVCGR